MSSARRDGSGWGTALPGSFARRRKLLAPSLGAVVRTVSWRVLTMVSLSTLLSVVVAQACTGYVAVNGALLEGEAACYFGTSTGVKHAYVRTDLLTAALELESDYLPETSTLRFEQGARTVDITATGDVALALSARNRVLSVNGQGRRGRSAILAERSYLPLVELVEAFGGSVRWNSAANLVVVNSSDPLAETSVAGTKPPAPTAPPVKPWTTLKAPRYSVHESYTRVAVDVPAGVTYQLAVDRSNFVVLFNAAQATPYRVTPGGPQLLSLGYTVTGDGATLALIVATSHPLSASGRGFKVGRLRRENGIHTLYIDFAPSLESERVARLQELTKVEPPTVQLPTSVQKTVVIDPGHGGHDPGALGEPVVEKDLVLNVALKLKKKLEARGIGVAMTRSDDTFVELEDRAGFAVPSKHNLFISLHANATETADAQGIETWVFGEPQNDSLIDLAVLENGGGNVGRERTGRARETAASIDGDLLREENLAYSTFLAEGVQRNLIRMTGGEDRGVKKNYFVVIRDARVPALLVELGFVNHPKEGRDLASGRYQGKLAEALADGLEVFLTKGASLTARRLSGG